MIKISKKHHKDIYAYKSRLVSFILNTDLSDHSFEKLRISVFFLIDRLCKVYLFDEAKSVLKIYSLEETRRFLNRIDLINKKVGTK